MGSSRKLKSSEILGSRFVGAHRRRVGREDALARLQESTAAYHEALTAGEKEEDAAVARASARAARRLVIDAPSSRRRRTG